MGDLLLQLFHVYDKISIVQAFFDKTIAVLFCC